MEDDDEFGEFDDIPDEDLVLALDQASSGVTGAGASQRGAQTNGTQFQLQSQNQLHLNHFRSSVAPAFRQTTLFGDTLRHGPGSGSGPTAGAANPSGPGRPFRADMPPELPTHHELVADELDTWVYPSNLGPVRDYQFSIVKSGLFNNTLVALPTGLGKTFIAATIMLNFLRWTASAKVVFVAPTKPLASQQVQACLGVAGIPRSQSTLLTGETPPVLREGEWASRRLFFMTPQTLMNDLSKGYADPKSIVLLVIDEAHRATGDYAYVKAVEFIRRFSKSFRVLALTATPGSSVEAVQDVINNLGISHVEIRTEESIDIRQYVYARNTETITFDPSEEMEKIKEQFSKALKPIVDKLSAQNIYFGRDPMSITTYGLLKSRQDWMGGAGRHANQGVKFMIFAVFGILQSLAHAIKLLNFHGVKPFYHNLAEFRNSEEIKGGQASKYRKQLLSDENFQKMMTMIESWMRNDEFYGHPKLSYLCETLVHHFVDAGEGSGTRAIVFSEYRDSAEEIVRLLNKQPLVRATVFVGQADSKRSEGMKQKQQIETIEKFKNGVFNVLVATSIGEEGLDIGQVDLIVCYDASSSPIRMLQRMGRTGRKRAGRIVLLLMKGKEEEKFNEAKRNYQEMQALICEGSRFDFRHDLSTRIVPRDAKPQVDMRHIEIPIENTQDPSLPEPKKTAAGLRKKPAKKKFNMPDGVETGFVKASKIGQSRQPTITSKLKPVPKISPPPEELAPLPDLDKVILTVPQTNELNRLYRDFPFGRSGTVEEIDAPSLTSHPSSQRRLTKTAHLLHGQYTRRCVTMLFTLWKLRSDSTLATAPYGETDTSDWENLPIPPYATTTSSNPVTHLPSRKRQVPEPSPATVPSSPKRPRQAQLKTASRGGKTKNPRRENTVRAFFADGADDSSSGDDGEGDELSPIRARSSPLPELSRRVRAGARGRGRNGGGGRGGRGGRGGLKRVGDDLLDLGDACDRTSDMEETDGSDDGADLEGFVVGDDEVTSSMARELEGGTSPITPRAGKAKERGRPFYEMVKFTQEEEEEEEEMPDLLSSVSRGGGKRVDVDGEEESEGARREMNGRIGRRRVLEDSDDED